MNLYVAVVESDKRPGSFIKMVLYVRTRQEAEKMARERLRKWTLRSLNIKRGKSCVLFLDEITER